jgi:hypothetical protein
MPAERQNLLDILCTDLYNLGYEEAKILVVDALDTMVRTRVGIALVLEAYIRAFARLVSGQRLPVSTNAPLFRRSKENVSLSKLSSDR